MRLFKIFCAAAAAALLLASCSNGGEVATPSSAVQTAAPTATLAPATATPPPSPPAEDPLAGLEVTFAGEALPVLSYNLEVYGFADAKGETAQSGSVRLAAIEDFAPQFETVPMSWELVLLDREGHPVSAEEGGAASFVLTAQYDEAGVRGEVRYSAALEVVGEASLELSAAEVAQGGVLLAEVTNAVGYAQYSVYLPHIDETVAASRADGRVLAFLPAGMAGTPGVQRAELRCSVGDGEPQTVATAEFTIAQTDYERQDLVTSSETQALYTSDNLASDNEKMRAARSVSNETPYFDGAFDMPLEGVMTTDFGMQRYVEGALQSRHSGYDIAAAEGTAIRAPEAGVVTFADALVVNGNTVVIDHGMNVFTSYSHMSEILVEEGDFVEKGAVIGYVGSTGYSTGAHLHYTVVVSGYYVDPAVTQDAAVFSLGEAAAS